MTNTDRVGRRCRDRRSPGGLRLVLSDRDLLWFEKLHRHGPLSSSFLLAYSKHTHRHQGRAKDRLTNLYHESDTHGAPFLNRPWQQFATYDARYNDLVYENSEGAERALKQAGRWHENTPAPGGPWAHRYMTAAITASIELATRATANVRYIFQDEVLNRAQRPLRFSIPNEAATEDLIPDALFGLEYLVDGKRLYRFFVVEADRSTEPARTPRLRRKSYERTILHYREFVGRDLYKQSLGLTASMLVLNVTTSEARKETLVALTRDLSAGSMNSYMLFTALPTFGRVFKPSKVLYDLFTGPWQRAGLNDLHINLP